MTRAGHATVRVPRPSVRLRLMPDYDTVTVPL